MGDEKRTITPASAERYKATRKKGLTSSGISYWVVSRLHLGGAPLVGGPKLPTVTEEELFDPEIGLPAELR